MNKLRLLLVGACALAAFFTVNGTAVAITDPDCDQYGNDNALHEFSIDTPDSHQQWAVSSVVGGGLACGTDISFPCIGGDTLYDHATVGVPDGVKIGDTIGHEGEDVGTANVNILYFAACVPILEQDVASTVEVNTNVHGGLQKCTDENAGLAGHSTPGDVIACYYGWNILGHNWNWVTQESNGKLWMTIGPMHGILGVDPGLTRIGMTLCAYFGCGQSGDFIQKNGDASIYDCPGGKGLYAATATMRSGYETPEVSSCVPWSATSTRGLAKAKAPGARGLSAKAARR